MSEQAVVDHAGRRRSPAAVPGYHKGRPAPSKGLRYPPDPPRSEEIIAVMRAAGEGSYGLRVRGLIVVLWRAGLRIGEALALKLVKIVSQARINFVMARSSAYLKS